MANMVAAGEAMDRVGLVPGETPRVRNFEYHETTPGYFGTATGICRVVRSFLSKVVEAGEFGARS
jgi:hypothetical protein